METKLHKLKVTELKELLAKHNLSQTGKKDDLVKRLVDHNVSVGDESQEEIAETGTLVDEANSSVTEMAGTAISENAPAVALPSTESAKPTAGDVTELDPEEKAKKARAERFGVPFIAKSKANAVANDPSVVKIAKEKPATVDKSSLGLSEDVLAKRAAKFGLSEKKPEEKKPQSKPETIDPELAAKIAIEEEKKRKRAEKFGLSKPLAETPNGSTEPVSTLNSQP
nr:hypothetical protein L203_01011 [Cryptococcus depauperatus CBS 7841]